MKKLLLLSFTVIASLSVSLAQPTIYTADINPGAMGGVNVFLGPTALVDAIAAAVDDDIIHVVRSSLNYGTITIDKRLNIFGIGLNPDTDGSQRSSVVTINIADPLASGTRISGLRTTTLNLGGTAGTLSDLLIENSYIRYIQHIDVTTLLTNIIIRNNVLGSSSGGTNDEVIDLLAGAMSNIIIANNVIYRVNTIDQGTINADNGTSVENNLFIGHSNASRQRYWAFEVFNGNTVKNNIFFRLRPTGLTSLNGNTFENNLSFDTNGVDGFSTVNGNISTNNLTGVDPLLANVAGSLNIDFAFFNPTLDVLSPAIGAGEDGTDMGVFGGPAPMKLSGTLIPLIQSLTLPSMVLKGTDLPVQIKAEGN